MSREFQGRKFLSDCEVLLRENENQEGNLTKSCEEYFDYLKSLALSRIQTHSHRQAEIIKAKMKQCLEFSPQLPPQNSLRSPHTNSENQTQTGEAGLKEEETSRTDKKLGKLGKRKGGGVEEPCKRKQSHKLTKEEGERKRKEEKFDISLAYDENSGFWETNVLEFAHKNCSFPFSETVNLPRTRVSGVWSIHEKQIKLILAAFGDPPPNFVSTQLRVELAGFTRTFRQFVDGKLALVFSKSIDPLPRTFSWPWEEGRGVENNRQTLKLSLPQSLTFSKCKNLEIPIGEPRLVFSFNGPKKLLDLQAVLGKVEGEVEEEKQKEKEKRRLYNVSVSENQEVNVWDKNWKLITSWACPSREPLLQCLVDDKMRYVRNSQGDSGSVLEIWDLTKLPIASPQMHEQKNRGYWRWCGSLLICIQVHGDLLYAIENVRGVDTCFSCFELLTGKRRADKTEAFSYFLLGADSLDYWSQFVIHDNVVYLLSIFGNIFKLWLPNKKHKRLDTTRLEFHVTKLAVFRNQVWFGGDNKNWTPAQDLSTSRGWDSLVISWKFCLKNNFAIYEPSGLIFD